MTRRALIIGVSGQDGAYLARHLLAHGYDVVGTSRDAAVHPLDNLDRLGVRDRVAVRSMAPTDSGSVLSVVRDVAPDEIYNLSGQSSVGLSFEQPRETFDSICAGTVNLLEAVRLLTPDARYYNACSSECFGDTGDEPADEDTPFRPRSPYGAAKAAAYWQVANYRSGYGLFAVSGILFNHESPLRPGRFVTQKIIRGASAIARGEASELVLGNLDVVRDWGWAPEYVVAMHAIVRAQEPRDYVVATGHSHSLEDFVEETFSQLGLKASDHVRSDPSLFRPADIPVSRANPDLVKAELGWDAQVHFRDIVGRMLAEERA